MPMRTLWIATAAICLLEIWQHVVGVTAANPSWCQIIHVLNWHYVPKAMFAVDLRDQADEPIPDDEIDRKYAEFLNAVEAVQSEQMALLRGLIQKYSIKQIHLEGFSDEELPAFHKRIEALREFQKHMPKGDSPIEQLILEEYRKDLLEIGAPGRLMIEGEVEVLPADDAECLEKANPIQNGKVQLDSDIIERREDAIVRNLVKGGSLVVLVMGGAHNLSDNVPNGCRYERVEVDAYRAVGGELALQKSSPVPE